MQQPQGIRYSIPHVSGRKRFLGDKNTHSLARCLPVSTRSFVYRMEVTNKTNKRKSQVSPREILPLRGHQAIYRDICGCHNWEKLLASSRWGPECCVAPDRAQDRPPRRVAQPEVSSAGAGTLI